MHLQFSILDSEVTSTYLIFNFELILILWWTVFDSHWAIILIFINIVLSVNIQEGRESKTVNFSGDRIDI